MVAQGWWLADWTALLGHVSSSLDCLHFTTLYLQWNQNPGNPVVGESQQTRQMTGTPLLPSDTHIDPAHILLCL